VRLTRLSIVFWFGVARLRGLEWVDAGGSSSKTVD
jgi:hypothetical protein